MTQQDNNGQPRTFNPNEHLMKIGRGEQAKDYLAVQWRLVWFRTLCPQGTIDTEELEYDLDRELTVTVAKWNPTTRRMEQVPNTAKGYARYRAVVTDGKGGRATGTKSECAASFEDFGEKAETGSIGRALAALGYGTQFTGDELSEGVRIVDSLVDRGIDESNHTDNGNGRKPIVAVRSNAVNSNGSSAPSASAEVASEALASDQQLASIRKICEHLGKAEPEHPETMSFASAKELIAQLSQEYRQSRKTQDQQPGAAKPAQASQEECTIQQVDTIRKLCQQLKEKEPQFTGMTYEQAKAHIARLNQAYSKSRRAS